VGRWQFYGTNVIAQGKAREAISDVRERWRAGVTVSERREGDVTAVLRIPRFGEDWEVRSSTASPRKHLPLESDGSSTTHPSAPWANYAPRGTPRDAWGTVQEPHRSRRWDEVVIETQSYVYTYVLDTGGSENRVTFTDTWVLKDRPVELPGPRIITLTTCAELFHTTTGWLSSGTSHPRRSSQVVDRGPATTQGQEHVRGV
jgi:sortase A